MKCDCMGMAMGALMAEGLEFTDLSRAFNVKGDSGLSVSTKRVDNGRKGRLLLLNFCPFCGMEINSGEDEG